MQAGGVGEVDPQTAWDALASDTKTLLVDVRTRAEWSFVGAPDLSALRQPVAFIEWQSFPTMTMNGSFAADVLGAVDQTEAEEVYFICRSGARSMSAAHATSAAAAAAGKQIACFNVAEGFEGDLNTEAKRGETNGWKARGLPWGQS